jgi:hypothetical protein
MPEFGGGRARCARPPALSEFTRSARLTWLNALGVRAVRGDSDFPCVLHLTGDGPGVSGASYSEALKKDLSEAAVGSCVGGVSSAAGVLQRGDEIPGAR